MKAITLYQPWASAIANGVKLIETRSWPTKYRGPVAIHAAKLVSKENKSFFEMALDDCSASRWSFQDHLDEVYEYLPFGAIVAVADLYDCQPVEKLKHELSLTETMWGNYKIGQGRYGFKLRNIKKISPIYGIKGFQKLWNLPETVALIQKLKNESRGDAIAMT